VRSSLRPALAVLKRDFINAKSYRVRFFTGLISGFANLAVFYYISRLVRLEGALSPDEYFAFVTIGVVIFTLVSATLTAPFTALRQELVSGTFERMLLAPSGAVPGIVALLLFPALYALLTALAMLCFAALVFGVDLHWSTMPVSVPLSILTLLAFAPFGVLMQASVIIGKKAPPGASYIIVAISLIAGLYFPVTLLPGWIEWTSQVQPFTPAADLLRWAVADQALPGSGWVATLKLFGFALVVLPVTVAVLRMALRMSRRRGTILEY
jgi:ABC-2 type transport system permease protein